MTIQSILDDLEIQAMLFDMDIDIETLSLVPKKPTLTRTWVDNWRDSLEGTAADPNENWETE